MVCFETLISMPCKKSFTLFDEMTFNALIERCKKSGTTIHIDMLKIDSSSLRFKFSEHDIIVLSSIEKLDENHELLYLLSHLLDFDKPSVFYVVSDKNKYNHIQSNKDGPLYMRWMWIDNFERFIV